MNELHQVAKRVVWFDSPEQTLQNPSLFLAHLMVYGTIEELIIAKRHYADDDFIEVLNHPPPGVFDARSWSYWNLVYDRYPAPPLGLRRFSAKLEKA